MPSNSSAADDGVRAGLVAVDLGLPLLGSSPHTALAGMPCASKVAARSSACCTLAVKQMVLRCHACFAHSLTTIPLRCAGVFTASASSPSISSCAAGAYIGEIRLGRTRASPGCRRASSVSMP